MSPTVRAFLKAWLIAPIPLAVVNMATEYIPPRAPRWDDLFGLVFLYGIGLLVGAVGLFGIVSALVFDRLGITGLVPHLVVGAIAGFVPFLCPFLFHAPYFAIEAVPFAMFGAWIYWRARFRSPAPAAT